MINKYFNLIFSFLLLCLLGLSSCETTSPEPEPSHDHAVAIDANHKMVLYKNQTGNATADAIQGQLVHTKDKYTMNFYGTFDADKNPDKLRTITFRKENNDTTVYLLMDQVSGRLQTAYLEVKGVKSPWVIRHDYIAGNDRAIKLAFYQYDWNSKKGTLMYEALYENVDGKIKPSPIYTMDLAGTTASRSEWAAAIGVGVIVAEVAFYGTGVALPTVVAAVAGPVVVVAAAVAVVGVVVAALSNDANASELKPGDYPYPANTPVNNPVTTTTNPTANLQPSGCNSSSIAFNVSMDGYGSIMVSGVTGGTGPYKYAVSNSEYQTSEVFSNNYPDGSYVIAVKDANGCVRAITQYLTRNASIAALLKGGSPWRITSYIVDNTDFFQFQDRGSSMCYPAGLYDKEKVIGGTFAMSEAILSLYLTYEMQKYDCGSKSYKVSNESYGSNFAWTINESTKTLTLLSDSKEVAKFNVSGSTKVTLSGTQLAGDSHLSTVFVLEK